jgi:hypothetical protein
MTKPDCGYENSYDSDFKQNAHRWSPLALPVGAYSSLFDDRSRIHPSLLC